MVKTFLVGRLTHEPELRIAGQNGSSVCTFSVAVDTRWKDEQGNYLPNFYRVTVWRQQGENCAKFLHKGDRVAVTGSSGQRGYIDKNGQQRFALEMDADQVEFLTTKMESQTSGYVAPAQAATVPASVTTYAATGSDSSYAHTPTAAPMPGADDDMPF